MRDEDSTSQAVTGHTTRQLPVCGVCGGGGDGLWFVNGFGCPKNGGDACHSEPGPAPCTPGGFHSGGRGDTNPGPGAEPQGGMRISGPLLRGLAAVPTAPAPHPTPTALGRPERRPGAVTISSSSAASADEPSTPFGLGVRCAGDVEPDPDAEADADADGSPAGRAIGAMGAVGRVIGPGSADIAVDSASDARRTPDPGASCVGDDNGFCTTPPTFMPTGPTPKPAPTPFGGGPIGAGGARFLPNASNGAPGPNPLGSADGASDGGMGRLIDGWIDGPGTKVCANGPDCEYGTRGESTGGMTLPPGENSGVVGCGGRCGRGVIGGGMCGCGLVITVGRGCDIWRMGWAMGARGTAGALLAAFLEDAGGLGDRGAP